jgi:hypothetical protein
MTIPRSRKLWLIPAGVIALTFLYPPYSLLRSQLGATTFGGYAWLCNISSIKDAAVAWPLLLVEWLAIAMVTGLIWRAFTD